MRRKGVLRCVAVLWWVSVRGDTVSRGFCPDTGYLEVLPNRHSIPL